MDAHALRLCPPPKTLFPLSLRHMLISRFSVSQNRQKKKKKPFRILLLIAQSLSLVSPLVSCLSSCSHFLSCLVFLSLFSSLISSCLASSGSSRLLVLPHGAHTHPRIHIACAIMHHLQIVLPVTPLGSSNTHSRPIVLPPSTPARPHETHTHTHVWTQAHTPTHKDELLCSPSPSLCPRQCCHVLTMCSDVYSHGPLPSSCPHLHPTPTLSFLGHAVVQPNPCTGPQPTSPCKFP